MFTFSHLSLSTQFARHSRYSRSLSLSLYVTFTLYVIPNFILFRLIIAISLPFHFPFNFPLLFVRHSHCFVARTFYVWAMHIFCHSLSRNYTTKLLYTIPKDTIFVRALFSHLIAEMDSESFIRSEFDDAFFSFFPFLLFAQYEWIWCLVIFTSCCSALPCIPF